MIEDIIKLLNKLINNTKDVAVIKWSDGAYNISFPYNLGRCSLYISSKGHITFKYLSNSILIDATDDKYKVLDLANTLYKKIQEEVRIVLKEVANDWGN